MYSRLNVARFSLQNTLVLRGFNVQIVLGWSEVKTVLQKIASTRECSSATTIGYSDFEVCRVDLKGKHPSLDGTFTFTFFTGFQCCQFLLKLINSCDKSEEPPKG